MSTNTPPLADPINAEFAELELHKGATTISPPSLLKI
jgi:hypothetical protein